MIELLSKPTRFRAYQLGGPGSSFSYFDGKHFTLIEAMLTKISAHSLGQELNICGMGMKINTLHITSWDSDHCSSKALEVILEKLSPSVIEIPGYDPKTEMGIESKRIIEKYSAQKNAIIDVVSIVKYSPINNLLLTPATSFAYSNVIFNPSSISGDSNNDSTVKFFRSGSFTVLSLGDVESPDVAKNFADNKILNSEVDVMILAHHGADNGFTTDHFVKRTNPEVAISSSNYDNQFEHPKPEIKKIFYDNQIPIYTTKTGDVIIKSIGDHKSQYEVYNLIGNSTELSSKKSFTAKRAKHSFSPLLQDLLRYK